MVEAAVVEAVVAEVVGQPLKPQGPSPQSRDSHRVPAENPLSLSVPGGSFK